jgi:acyl-coenzyme A thioesterase PaaI-like protein
MPVVESRQARLEEMRRREHPRCIVCGSNDGSTIHPEFRARDEGGVEASFRCTSALQGYDGLLHGGAISMLLDAAMTNCLFSYGIAAVTGKLEVRFRLPVAAGREASVIAWVTRSSPPLHLLQAEIVQEAKVVARAKGSFMERGPGVP